MGADSTQQVGGWSSLLTVYIRTCITTLTTHRNCNIAKKVCDKNICSRKVITWACSVEPHDDDL